MNDVLRIQDLGAEGDGVDLREQKVIFFKPKFAVFRPSEIGLAKSEVHKGKAY